MKFIVQNIRFLVRIICLTNLITIHTGYYFRNNFPEQCTITMYDQDNEPVVENFELQPEQALIFSCKYLKKQGIDKLTIFKLNTKNNKKTELARLCVSCPSSYYIFYDLLGQLLTYEHPAKAIACFKGNVQQCLFIKRGYILHGLFLRNIEQGEDLLITLQDEKNEQLVNKLTLAPNGELYLSANELLRNLNLQITSNFRSNETNKRIPIYEEQFPYPIRSFDAQPVYSVSVGLGLIFNHGMNQFNEPTKKSLKKFSEYLSTTLFPHPRVVNPLRLHQCIKNGIKKYASCIFKNTKQESYKVTVLDQDNRLLIASLILAPQQTFHLASSYLQKQSVHSLNLIAQNTTDEKQAPIRSALILTPRTNSVACEKYTIFGDFILSLNDEEFRKKKSLCETNIIRRGFVNNGLALRNIGKLSCILSIKDDHNKPIGTYSMSPNGEIYFPAKFFKKANIECLFITLYEAQKYESSHSDEKSNEPCQKPLTSSPLEKEKMNMPIKYGSLIKVPHHNFDTLITFNICLTLKKFNLGPILATKRLLNQFNEPSQKPALLPLKSIASALKATSNNNLSMEDLKKNIANILYHNTVFFENSTEEPLVMKKRPMANTSEEVSGPISPSTKI